MMKKQLFLLYFISGSTFLFSQEVVHIQVAQLPAHEVLQLLEERLQLTFNYNHDFLPKGLFSFSCKGDQKAILHTTFASLNRRYTQLDANIYAIQTEEYTEGERPAPLTLRGEVLDAAKGDGLTGATIWLPRLMQATQSDQQGSFLLQGYFDPEELVEIRFLGYQSIQIKVARFVANPEAPLSFALQPELHILGQIEVTDYLPWKNKLAHDHQELLRPEKMKPIAGSPDNDVLSIAQLLPGLYNASESLAELQTRGGPPDQTDLNWNGIPIFQPSHFFGKISAINPLMVDQIQVVRNGGSAAQAGQASGSLNMQSQARHDDSLSLRLQSNLLYSNFGLRLPFQLGQQKQHLHFAMRQSHGQFLENIIYRRFFDQVFQYGKLPDEAFYIDFYDIPITQQSSVSYHDLSLNLDLSLGDGHQLKLSAIQLDNEFLHQKVGDIFPESTPTDELDFQNRGLSAVYRFSKERYTQEVSWSISQFDNQYHYRYTPNDISLSEEIQQSNHLRQSSLQLKHSYRLDFAELRVGYQLRSWAYDIFYGGRAAAEWEIYSDEDNSKREHSAFVQALWQPNNRWQLETGLRWSNYNGAVNQLWEPRIHFSAFLLPRLTFHAHAGWYHQVLHQRNNFTNFQAENGFWFLSDETQDNFIPVVHNRQLSTGLRYQYQGWGLNAEVYLKKIRDVWTSVLDFDIYDNPYQYSDIDIKGLELSVQYDSKWVSLLWSYDYIHERLKLWDDTRFPSPFLQPHRFSLYQGFKWRRLELSLHWRFATGRLFSVPSSFESTIDTETGSESYQLTFGELLTQKVEAYHRLDLGLRYAIGKANGKIRGNLNFTINNLYDRNNILENQYFIDYRKDPVGTTLLSRRGLPFTPNIGVELYWGVKS